MSKEAPEVSEAEEVQSAALQAAEWLEILHDRELSGDARQRAHERFLKWVRKAPLHSREFLFGLIAEKRLRQDDRLGEIDVQGLMREAAALSTVTPIGPHVERVNAEREQARIKEAKRDLRRSRWLRLLAAAGALFTIPLAGYAVYSYLHHFTTAVGEQRSITLADGSTMRLNTDSRVRVSFTKQSRDIYLERGQALFEVAHNAARPFRVHAGPAVVRAIGTQFDVQLLRDHVAVSVVEGAVQVSTDVQPKAAVTEASTSHDLVLPKLAAGQGVTVSDRGRIGHPVTVAPQAAAGWWTQQLTFSDTPLGEIAYIFNQYHHVKLHIEGSALAAQPYSGVFGARNPESLIKLLEADPALDIEHRDDEVVVRARGNTARDSAASAAEAK